MMGTIDLPAGWRDRHSLPQFLRHRNRLLISTSAALVLLFLRLLSGRKHPYIHTSLPTPKQ